MRGKLNLAPRNSSTRILSPLALNRTLHVEISKSDATLQVTAGSALDFSPACLGQAVVHEKQATVVVVGVRLCTLTAVQGTTHAHATDDACQSHARENALPEVRLRADEIHQVRASVFVETIEAQIQRRKGSGVRKHFSQVPRSLLADVI